MRKLVMKMSMSVDGFVCGSDGGKDWLFKTADPESGAWSLEKIQDAGLFIMGRKSFEDMAPYWASATGPFAEPMNAVPKAVFTQKGFAGIDLGKPRADQSPAEKSWTEARIFDGDLAENIQMLKSESGRPIVAIGGAGFMQSLIATDLIDEYHLAIHPVALGAGLPIFTRLELPRYLKPSNVRIFPAGIIATTYSKA